MLIQLSIRDAVLIEKLDLTFKAGLTVLTGETGAGKSILLDSLSLALGYRASSGFVRNGADLAVITACFDVPPSHPTRRLLHEMGISLDDPHEPLVLRRSVTKDGRSKAYLNDQPVGAGALRLISSLLIEIQGQHAQMGLADESAHLDLLDAFGSAPATLEAVKASFESWKEAVQRLDEAQKKLSLAQREEEWLRHAVDDLSKLAPEEDEEDQLAALRIELQQNERRSEAVAAALAELTPRDRRSPSPATALRNASRFLGRLVSQQDQNAGLTLSPVSPANEALSALEKAEEALAEAETVLSRLVADSDVDPTLLEQTEERLFALRAAGRKHNVGVNALAPLLTELRSRLEALDHGHMALEKLACACQNAFKSFEKNCDTLSAERTQSAIHLESAIMSELKAVRLERARFVVSLTPLKTEKWSHRGKEGATFMISANPGQAPAPLDKVASGGELSRLMLALKVVLSKRADTRTVIFDEVDSGVGGATASAIGNRLHALARDVQVLVVTHSPQVAARGDQHFKITKRIRAERTETHAESLTTEHRREEIARMLAGETITDAARSAAISLLETPR